MPALVPVADAVDPRVEPYLALRERDLRGREDLFVAEGEVVLRVLLTRSRFPVHSVFLSEKRLEACTPLLAGLPGSVPVYVAPQAVMAQVVGFPIHRGVLALGRRVGSDAATLLRDLADPALVVGLVGLANHDNVGGVFRNAAAFGAGAVLMDRATCDPLYRKAIRVSVGASLFVPFAAVPRPTDLLDLLEAAGFSVFALSPGGVETLDAVAPARRSALLLGAEGPGLPADVLARVRTIRIPMTAGFDSLNVATASGIALHRFAEVAAAAARR
ncbi:MAG TPA: RNA methyltransferase [Beijerinckiaceae bacterium]|nr:RNA methyltransferase [Beijerinckiaceae bacterium]